MLRIKQTVVAVAVMVLAIPLSVVVRPVGSVAAVAQQSAQQQPQLQPTADLPQQTEQSGVYRGVPKVFRIRNKTTGRIDEVVAADFVRGAVAAEMPALYHPEALKAQAVAAYSYAVRQALQQRANSPTQLWEADFEADPQNMQVYLTEKEAGQFYGEDFDFYWNKVCEAADFAGKYILLYEGQPAAAAYHAISAGTTEDAAYVWQGEQLPYLKAVESPGDLLSAGYESRCVLGSAELKKLLEGNFDGLKLPEDSSRWLAVTQRSPSGYVTAIQVGDHTVTGLELRFLLGLRSSHFQVERQGDDFVFTVQGFGHGVGLSQNGADYMARQGATFDEILLHYYPGTELALAAE